MSTSEIDLIIVGAGIAGLRTGIKYLAKNPRSKVVILEEYNYIGGRMVTYKKNGLQWENGAGRIHKSHKLVGQLVDKYKLTRMPINDNIKYVDSLKDHLEFEETAFADSPILSQLLELPAETLKKYTVDEILDKVIGSQQTASLLSRFPYNSETHYMRADLALKGVLEDELSTYNNYYGIAEGIQEIAKRMAAEFEAAGGEIRKNHRVIAVRDAVDSGSRCCELTVRCQDSKGSCESKKLRLVAAAVVLALHSAAVKQLIPDLPVLKHLVMTPLLRIYAVFPKSSKGSVWFKGFPKIVTNSPLRFIIPISEKDGTIMISYTDADDTRTWMKEADGGDERKLTDHIMREVRSLFKDLGNIPDPTFIKAHPWSWGTTYWLPGDYDPIKESQGVLTISRNLHICGESFSLRQAWMEGALEHADELAKIL